MIRLILSVVSVLSAYSAPLVAQEVDYDITSFGGTGCMMTLTPDAPHVAEIRCSNVETMGNAYDEGAMAVGEMVVEMTILHGPGDIPDRFTLTAPPGFIITPDVLVLNENTSETALIFEWTGM